MTDYVYRTITREEFVAWLKLSTPRPIVAVGKPTDSVADEADWLAYVHAVEIFAGYWNADLHGAYSLLSVGSEWIGKRLYMIPTEQVAHPAPENLYNVMRSRGHSARRKDEDAVREAIKNHKVDRRFRFPAKANHLLRVAARSTWDTISRGSVREAGIEAIVTAAFKFRFDDKTPEVVPRNLPQYLPGQIYQGPSGGLWYKDGAGKRHRLSGGRGKK